MCYKNYLSCHIFKDDGLWMLKVVNILDGEENRWESIRAKSDTNYNPTASVTNEKFFENIA